MPRTTFDAAYYRRFYLDRRRRVARPEDTAVAAEFVASYLRFLGVPVRSVLDVGCGLGWWRAPLEAALPGVRWTGIEVSEHLCDSLGWTRASLTTWKGRPADLVICQGVLQYVPDDEIERAMTNVLRLSKRALFLEALTAEDWERNVDQERTDGEVALRPAAFYRDALDAAGFVPCGGGLFVRRGQATFFSLETLGA